MKSTIAYLRSVPFVRDIVTMQFGQVIGTGAGFVASIVFARLLGLQGYGTYALVLGCAGLLGFITNLGQQTTALTFFAEAYGKKDREQMKNVLQYYFVVSLCSSLLIVGVILVLPWLSTLLYSDPTIGALARIIFLSSIIDPLFVFGSIALQSIRKIRALTILENSRIVLQLGLSVLFIYQGLGVAGALLGSLVGTAIMSLVSLSTYASICSTYNLPTLREVIYVQRLTHVWKLVKSGFFIAIDKNVSNQYPNLFIVTLGIFAPESVVGLVRLSFKLGSLPASFILSNISKLSSSVIPTLFGSGSAVSGSLWKLIRYASALHIAGTAGAILVIPQLIPLVYGDAFSVAVYPFIVIALLQTTNVIHIVNVPILRLHNRIYYTTIFNSIGFVIATAALVLLQEYVRTTLALYAALTLYHSISLLVVFKVYGLVKARYQTT